MNNISLYSQAGRLLKGLLGIKDMSLFLKDTRKRFGKLIYKRKYSASDIISVMKELGMQKGSVICIHASMKEFYNYTGTAKELIDLILKEIGSEGTLIMPAFPSNNLRKKSNYIFDKEKDPTGAGYLAETFRTYPGVLRSINVQHSVCAIGKYAVFLTKDHQYTHDCWDEKSPWQRMISLNAIVFSLGMPSFYIGTFDHCVESILQYEHPYWAQFFTACKDYQYYNESGGISTYSNYTSEIDRRTREKNVTKFFTPEHMQDRHLSNLLIRACYSDKCLPLMLKLGKKGIGIYYVPNPKNFSFE